MSIISWMKVYTCVSEAILAEYVPFPNAKAQLYNEDAPNTLQMRLIDGLNMLREKVSLLYFNSLDKKKIKLNRDDFLTRI